MFRTSSTGKTVRGSTGLEYMIKILELDSKNCARDIRL